jgi:hypothetical protein
MSYDRDDPESDHNAELIKAVDTFRVAAQAILFGSFVLLAFQIVGQYLAVSLSRTGSSRYVHIASITLMMLTILWVGPVAFPSEAAFVGRLNLLYRVGKRNLTMATVLLAAGISADVYVVTRIEVHSYALAISLAATMLALGYAIGFGVPLYFKR